MNKDILLNELNEPVITDGDFTIANSDLQHIYNTLQITPGMCKQYPTIGIGILKNLNGNITLKETSYIKRNLKELGYNNASVVIENGNIIINI